MILRRLLTYLKPAMGRFVMALIGMSLVAGISTAVVWTIKFLVDHALTQKDLEALKSGVLVLLCLIATKSILWYTHTYLAGWVSHSAARRLRDEVYWHLYSLSMGFFNSQSSGGILARLTNDITVLQTTLVSGPTVIVRDGLTVLGLVGFLFYTNWKFALMSFMVLPVVGYLLTHLGKKSRRSGREGQARMADMYSTIHEALTAMPIVKVFQNESNEIADFARQNRTYFDVVMKLVRVDARSAPMMESLGACVLAFLLIVGGRDVIEGTWSLGSFVAFIGAAISLYNPIKKFSSVNVQLQQGLAAAERVFELLDQKGTVLDAPDAIPAHALASKIEFRNLAFSYPTGNVVLQDLNLSINKGEVVALVGPSGSGKTTIAQLFLRFYDPTQGAVLMDGQDFRTLTIQSLRNQMAVVTQETHLFNDTVLANIGYGRPTATREEIVEAAKAAYAHDFIEALPQGYGTVIGERGTRLSGGEKQRLAIARALLKNPKILVLDEATSALDVASEQVVQKALDRLLEGRTVLMIAHRLSTVRKAHRIVVLDKGRISEVGSHDELLNRRGAYHKLYELHAIA